MVQGSDTIIPFCGHTTDENKKKTHLNSSEETPKIEDRNELRQERQEFSSMISERERKKVS